RREVFLAAGSCGDVTALQATPMTSVRTRRTLSPRRGRLGEVFDRTRQPDGVFPNMGRGAAMLPSDLKFQFNRESVAASVLVELDKGWRDCVASVSSTTLTQRVRLVITAAGQSAAPTRA